MLMDVGLDTGPMLLKKATPLGPNEDILTLHDRMSLLGAQLLGETLDGLKAGQIIPEPQDDSQSCYAPLLKKEYGLIDWQKPTTALHNLVRGLAAWPGAVTLLNGTPFKLYRTVIAHGSGIPGTVIATSKEGIEVACGQGSLLIKELQAPGSKRMDAGSFLAGHPIPVGTLFTTPETTA
jgi:methionyl-tRNA formyltransferase